MVSAHKPEYVLENDSQRFLSGIWRYGSTNPGQKTFLQKGSCQLDDITVSTDYRMKLNESENRINSWSLSESEKGYGLLRYQWYLKRSI